jgi:Zn-dependent M28 family amino/carboxypeptidase
VANRALAADYLETLWDELGLEPERHAYDEGGTNIYARLPATTTSTRYFVVGAHYDSVPQSPGANDNATGVAFVYGLARYLEQLPCRDAHVIFVLFDQEEIGLVGSYAFAELLFEQRLDVVAVHTIDQMGWDADEDRAIELERPDRGLVEAYQQGVARGPADVPLITTSTGATDHVSFREWGFAAVGLTEEYVSGDTTPHYHLPSDTYDTVSFEYLRSTTVLGNATFARLLRPR